MAVFGFIRLLCGLDRSGADGAVFLCKKPAVLPPVILFIFLFLFFGSLVFSLFSVLIAVIGLGVKGGDITLVVIFDLYL